MIKFVEDEFTALRALESQGKLTPNDSTRLNHLRSRLKSLLASGEDKGSSGGTSNGPLSNNGLPLARVREFEISGLDL
jgi:hypothetical protein